jgi:hypothetical protein
MTNNDPNRWLRYDAEKDISRHIGVNLTSNPVTESCLTIKARSPLAPLKKGGDKILLKVPFLKGDLGGSRLR